MTLLSLLVLVILFVAVVWGGFYVCDRAGFPVPIRWIWGAVCLIVLLYILLSHFGGAEFFNRPLTRP